MCGGKNCGKYTRCCVVWGEKPNMHSKCVEEERDALGRERWGAGVEYHFQEI